METKLRLFIGGPFHEQCFRVQDSLFIRKLLPKEFQPEDITYTDGTVFSRQKIAVYQQYLGTFDGDKNHVTVYVYQYMDVVS